MYVITYNNIRTNLSLQYHILCRGNCHDKLKTTWHRVCYNGRRKMCPKTVELRRSLGAFLLSIWVNWIQQRPLVFCDYCTRNFNFSSVFGVSLAQSELRNNSNNIIHHTPPVDSNRKSFSIARIAMAQYLIIIVICYIGECWTVAATFSDT